MTALNQKMNMLSAIGIILVVAGHCGISFIRQFPVYSFHMPLFIFISGYFFQARPFPEFFRKKFVRLILPLALWSMFYTYFINGLHDMGLAGWHYSSDLSTILWRSLVQGWNPQFNVPAWFLSTLFWTQLLYWGIYKVTKKNLLLTGGVSAAAYVLSLYLHDTGFASALHGAGIGIERVLFFLLFYWSGGAYRRYIETGTAPSVRGSAVKIALCAAVNLGLISLTGSSSMLAFNIHHMDFPAHSYWMPLVTAATGICLYLQLADHIAARVRRPRFLSYLGRHTLPVMMHHQFFFWLVNAALWAGAAKSEWIRTYFDYDKYMTSIYYRIQTPIPREDVLYLAAGILGPLLGCWMYGRWIGPCWQRLLARVRGKRI